MERFKKALIYAGFSTLNRVAVIMKGYSKLNKATDRLRYLNSKLYWHYLELNQKETAGL